MSMVAVVCTIVIWVLQYIIILNNPLSSRILYLSGYGLMGVFAGYLCKRSIALMKTLKRSNSIYHVYGISHMEALVVAVLAYVMSTMSIGFILFSENSMDEFDDFMQANNTINQQYQILAEADLIANVHQQDSTVRHVS
jgi:hypothetical protein